MVQGSNDNTNWTTLTTGAAATPEWQTFPVTGGVPYRYIRIWNGAAWYAGDEPAGEPQRAVGQAHHP